MLLAEGTSFFGEYHIYWPAIWLFIGASLAVGIDMSAKRSDAAKPAVFWAAFGSVLVAITSIVYGWFSQDAAAEVLGLAGTDAAGRVFSAPMHLNALVWDGFGDFMTLVVLIGTGICMLASYHPSDEMHLNFGDYLALVLVSAIGMLLLCVSNDLIMLFLAIELMSLAIYVLAGIHRQSGRSAESALKYFIMGSFASGFLAMGFALIYGATGEIELGRIGVELTMLDGGDQSKLALLGLGLVVIGFAFKVGGVPFHQWVPDVYSGAPMPVTGFMAVAVKAAAFTALIRVVMLAVPAGGELNEAVMKGLWLVAALTVIVGNVLAVTQENLKRMLAYSSVAHSGYLLIGVLAARSHGVEDGITGVMFYLLVYTIATAGSFALLGYLSGERDVDNVRDIKGLAWKEPGMALSMAVLMFSLAGIPLTGGFVGKFGLFKGAIESEMTGLAVLGVLGSVVGAYYYLKVVVYMYMREPEKLPSAGEVTPDGVPSRPGWLLSGVVATAAMMSVIIGIVPWNVLANAGNGARNLLQTRVQIFEEGREAYLRAEQERQLREIFGDDFFTNNGPR